MTRAYTMSWTDCSAKFASGLQTHATGCASIAAATGRPGLNLDRLTQRDADTSHAGKARFSPIVDLPLVDRHRRGRPEGRRSPFTAGSDLEPRPGGYPRSVCRPALDEPELSRGSRVEASESTRFGKGLCGLSGCGTSTNVFIAAYRRYD